MESNRLSNIFSALHSYTAWKLISDRQADFTHTKYPFSIRHSYVKISFQKSKVPFNLRCHPRLGTHQKSKSLQYQA